MSELLIKIMEQIDWELREEGCYLELDELMELAEAKFLSGDYDA